eukprot:TRINITY_DN8159_c0_g1_i4.p2 TRINITY_DN8159_c0_g1~~TRINITY_DN8159_c0_g1_i4.p2  ORF type:complete len:114 (+),score=11.01 TRINITY_DN8159_c0_g1_i4:362-703(+)
MSEVTQVLKELSDQKGGIKDKTKLPRFFQLVQKEQELRGRVQITASIKSSSSSIHRELLNQGILSFLEAWLSDAVQKKKFDFAKVYKSRITHKSDCFYRCQNFKQIFLQASSQ